MKNVADIYPLTPTQAGILYHALRSTDPELYFEQVRFDLTGPLDHDVLRRALDHVVQRHPMLRTQFLWEGVPEPVQVVRETVVVPWETHDWTSSDTLDVATRLEDLAANIRSNGMAFDAAPLLRIVVVRLSATHSHLFWNSHHLLLDGWSSAQIFDEWAIAYHALVADHSVELPPAPPFRDFVAWRRTQDVDACREYWTRTLADFTEPTPVPALRNPASTQRCHTELVIDRETTASLRQLAQRQRTTLNTVLLAAWGVVLGNYHSTDDVVVGATFSGRPPDLAGVESIVGMFVTTLPVRLRPTADRTFSDWLGEVQTDQAMLREFQHVSPKEVAGWSDLAPGASLFNSTFVFENYPIADNTDDRIVDFAVSSTFDQSHFDLDVLVLPTDTVRFAASHDAARLPRGRVHHLLAHLQSVLAAVATDPTVRIDQLQLTTDEERAAIAAWSTAGALPETVTAAVDALEATEIPDAVLTDAARLVRHLARRQDDVVAVPGSMLASLLATFDDLALRLPHIHTWIATGTTPSDDLITAFADVLPGRALFIPYDLDSGVRLGWHHTAADEHLETVALVPCAESGMRLLDEQGRLAPVNAEATIEVAGQPVGRGRWIGDGRIELPLTPPNTAADPAVPSPAPSAEDDLSGIEAEVLLLWREALDRNDIGLDDDFFAMGGQSIVAVGLFAKISQRFDSNLSLSVLFEAATARELAALIAGVDTAPRVEFPTEAAAIYAGRPWLHLVEIEAGDRGVQPLVFVHGAGGNVLSYQALSERIGKHRPFYGIQASGIDGIQPPHRSVDEMVDAYLGELRAIFPDGPYILGGYSGGGVIAYEMAHRLRTAGKAVDNVMLIDTIHPSISAQSLGPAEHLHRVLRQGPSYIMEKWQERTQRDGRRATAYDAVADLDSRGELVPFQYRDTQLTKNLFDIIEHYTTPRYDGAVVMLKAEVNRDGWQHTTADNGWAPLAPNLTVIKSPGDHDAMIVEPHVSVLAQHIVDRL